VRVAALCAALALLAPSAAGARATTCESVTHRVVAGDTLSALGARYHVGVTALARANGLDPNGFLQIGLVLRIPSGCTSASLARSLQRAARSSLTTGAAVIDLASGATVYEDGATALLAPASTEKLPLATAALQLLGPGFRTETTVLSAGGNLYLKGYGDPLLRRSGLVRLARQVRAHGITTVRGSIVGDESYFDAHRTAPGWKPEFYGEESPPLSALVVDRGMLDGEVKRGVAPPAALQVGRLASPPLLRIIDQMDTWSDNFVAETLLKLLGAHRLAKGTTSAGAEVVRATLADDGVRLDGRLADGSGLSTLDRLSAGTLASLVAYVWRTPSLRPLLGTLAVAGVSGTLRHRLVDVPGHALVHGKTGSTDESSALVGVVADRFAFAIIENGTPVDFAAAHAAQDRFVQVLLRSI
jgi:serine-type D-Ala-D-Ala carboxypeptidase/endopeptidase (penicillin-binding protein 4)